MELPTVAVPYSEVLVANGCGYFEDRSPISLWKVYLVMRKITETCLSE